MRRLSPAILLAALATGCATPAAERVVTVYGSAAVSYDGRPANWSVERALEGLTDGSLAVDSRTIDRNGQRLSHALLTTADRDGRPIHIEAVSQAGSPTVLLIDYAGDAAPLADAIAGSLGERGYRVDRRQPHRAATASFSPDAETDAKPDPNGSP